MDNYLVRVEDSNDMTFTLANPNERVAMGIWYYELDHREADSNLAEDGSATDWFLKRQPGGDEGGEFTPGGDTPVSFAGSQRYLHWADLEDLRKRLGEVRYGSQDGLWARLIAQKDLADGDAGASGMKQNYRALNIGFDHLVGVSEERMWLLGGSFTAGEADQETRTKHVGKGETTKYGVNAYATWASHAGSYMDLVLSADWYDQEVKTLHEGKSGALWEKGSWNTWGAGASIEIGHMFSNERDDLSWGPWYRHLWIEPQLQLAYYFLHGEDYSLPESKIDISIGNEDSLIGRAGVVIGSRWNMGENYEEIDRRYVQLMLKAGVKHDFLGESRLVLNDHRVSTDIGRTTFYYGLGADWQITDRTRFYVQAEREEGDGYTKEYEVSGGIKYEF